MLWKEFIFKFGTCYYDIKKMTTEKASKEMLSRAPLILVIITL